MVSTEAPDAHDAPDLPTALGAAVALGALAGLCALLAEHLLLGALRLAAGVLAGAALGVLLLVLLSVRLAPRPRRLAAAGLAVVLALALTVPAVLATRPGPLEDRATLTLEALGEGDAVHSLPSRGSPVLVRRADGSAEILLEGEVRTLDADPGDVLALSADGDRLLQATGSSTTVHSLDATATAPPEAPFPVLEVEGSPVALDGDLLVVRRCEGELCRLSGIDLTAPDEVLWTLSGSSGDRGPDPAGLAVPARAERPPGLLDAARATGVLPAVPLRFDPAQGWFQIDPATGFPLGRLLAGPEEECRLAVTASPPALEDPLVQEPMVLTACSAEDGALRAAAHRDGERVWESEASPAGTWTVRLEQGRVIAAGTEEGTSASGEMVASEHSAQWAPPGADGLAQASTATARLGIDGARMILATEDSQLVAYDTADGTALWTLPLPGSGAGMRGELRVGTAVVLDPVERRRPLDPRGAQRLRVIDAATGEVALTAATAEEVREVRALGGGRALVTVGDRSLLLGP